MKKVLLAFGAIVAIALVIGAATVMSGAVSLSGNSTPPCGERVSKAVAEQALKGHASYFDKLRSAGASHVAAVSDSKCDGKAYIEVVASPGREDSVRQILDSNEGVGAPLFLKE